MRDALLQQPQRSQTFQPLLLNQRGEAGPPVPLTRGRIESNIPTTTDAPQQPQVKVTHWTLPDIRDRFGFFYAYKLVKLFESFRIQLHTLLKMNR